MGGPDGYRRDAAGGPRLRADIVDVYIFRRRRSALEFLQLLRASEPLIHTWHPVMGHIERNETAVACAARELEEEVGLRVGDAPLLGLWALEQVHPYYVAEIDQIVLSPRFAAEVAPSWKPRINNEHERIRWVKDADVATRFMWPGQVAACREIAALVRRGSLAAPHLLLTPRPARAPRPRAARRRR
jgi:8-oxo-dGTP pyrophosphatase MutT (NUDIX family)